MAKLSPVFNDQSVDINGDPLNGAQLFTYVAGSSTKIATYTNSAGTIPQTNPIILNSLGYPTNGPIWIAEGTLVKFVLAPSTDTDPPTSPIKTIDNVQGVNDSSTTVSQWTASGTTPTYVNATTFTLAGDQTSAFEPGRRVQFTTSGGTVYGTILTSVFAALTTVTMQMDGAQVLDSGLSVANLSILTTTNPAYPYFLDSVFKIVDEADKTKKFDIQLSGLSAATTRSWTIPNYSGTPAVPSTEGAFGLVLSGSGIGSAPTWGNGPSNIRQTVLSGTVDSSGFSAFGGATGATTVTTSTTLRATAAAGGDAHYDFSVTNPSWTGLSTNGLMYLYLDFNTTTGAVTTGSTTLVPVYQWGGAYSITNNQHTFNIQEMTMKVGNAATATTVARVFVGEVTVAAGVVSAITWYALMGRYSSGRFAIALNTAYTRNHNLGVEPLKAQCLGASTVGGALAEFIKALQYNGATNDYVHGALNGITRTGSTFNAGQTAVRILNGTASNPAAVEAIIFIERGW